MSGDPVLLERSRSDEVRSTPCEYRGTTQATFALRPYLYMGIVAKHKAFGPCAWNASHVPVLTLGHLRQLVCLLELGPEKMNFTNQFSTDTLESLFRSDHAVGLDSQLDFREEWVRNLVCCKGHIVVFE
jgi:hypothetical protein